MKKFFILCLVVALSTICQLVISYEGGRAGMPISIFNLPAEIVPYFINFACAVSLLVLLFMAMAKRKQVIVALFALLLSIGFAAVGFITPPIKVFQLGFRERIKATLSADELRQIARVFQENAPTNGFLPGPRKGSLWTENEHGPLWTKMTNSTSLGKLDDWVVVFKHPDEVELSWGGALVGHWGVRIKNEPATSAGDIAPGIATFISD